MDTSRPKHTSHGGSQCISCTYDVICMMYVMYITARKWSTSKTLVDALTSPACNLRYQIFLGMVPQRTVCVCVNSIKTWSRFSIHNQQPPKAEKNTPAQRSTQISCHVDDLTINQPSFNYQYSLLTTTLVQIRTPGITVQYLRFLSVRTISPPHVTTKLEDCISMPKYTLPSDLM